MSAHNMFLWRNKKKNINAFLMKNKKSTFIAGAVCRSSSLTHYRLNELTHTIYWKILISILGMSGYVI